MAQLLLFKISVPRDAVSGMEYMKDATKVWKVVLHTLQNFVIFAFTSLHEKGESVLTAVEKRREGCFQDTMPVATDLSLAAQKAFGASIFSVGCNSLSFSLVGAPSFRIKYDMALGTPESNSCTAESSVYSLLFICTTINLGRSHPGPLCITPGHEQNTAKYRYA